MNQEIATDHPTVPVSQNPGFQEPDSELAKLMELLEADFSQSQADRALQRLADHFVSSGEYDRLFEIRKLQSRRRLGVPAVYLLRPADLTADIEKRLEIDLAAAAAECGQLYAAKGQIAAAWNYLRVVEDVPRVRQILSQAPVEDDQIHAAIEVCLHQQAAPVHGMRLAARHLGTCSSITLFDSLHQSLGSADLLETAGVLVAHLCEELVASIERRLGRESVPSGVPAGRRLHELLQTDRPAIGHGSPHLDPSHLYSVLRIGRTQTERAMVESLQAMADYADLLPDSVRYAGDSPFEHTALHHRWWYGAVSGQFEKEAREHFCGNFSRYANTAIRAVAREYGVLLFWNLSLPEEAVRLAFDPQEDQASGEYGLHGIGPHPIAMLAAPGLATMISSRYRERGDLLGFVLSRLM